jgi:xanthine dehydrogenase accessory factor
MLENFTPGAFSKIPLKGSAQGPDFALLESVAPPPSLFIAGAGHIGKVMTHLGQLIGFEVTVWDYRPEFANTTHLPDASRIICCKAEEIPDQVTVGKDTWIIIVTHGHRYDGDVLKHFIGSEAAYIGMIGSKAKVSQMRDHFIKERWATPEQWDRIYSPIGLGIGAKTVEEIAVAIAAQLVQVKYEKEKSHA